MRRLLVLALCIAFLLALGVVISQVFEAEWVSEWISDVIGPNWLLGVWGPLLFFAPLALFMALTILVLWVVGRWFGRRNR